MARRYLNKYDVMKLTGKKDTWAITKIRELNDELEAKGFIVCRGRIPEDYFYSRMGFNYINEEVQ